MDLHWKSYWKESLKGGRSFFLAMGAALLIWAFELPQTDSKDYLRSFIVACTYGTVIFLCIWILYALVYAGLTHRMIRSGRVFKLGWGTHLAIVFTAMPMGLVGAKWLESQMFGEPFVVTGFRESMMVGSFISLAFLFNSLNSLSELIESDPRLASGVAMKLSDLYREILENSKKHLASLESEISMITKYLELERVRFGDRLRFQIEVPEERSNSYKEVLYQSLGKQPEPPITHRFC